MKTRCPSCQTTFRVSPEQLKARAGKVRCGQCQSIFNALDGLLDAPNARNDGKFAETARPDAPAPVPAPPAPATARTETPTASEAANAPGPLADVADIAPIAPIAPAEHSAHAARQAAQEFTQESARVDAVSERADKNTASEGMTARATHGEAAAPSLAPDADTETPAAETLAEARGEPHAQAPQDAAAGTVPDEIPGTASGEAPDKAPGEISNATPTKTTAETADKRRADAAALNAALADNLILPRETTEIPGYSKWAEGVMSAPLAPAAPTPHKSFVLIALLLALALGGQIIYHWRGEIVLAAPSLRPALNAMSQALGHDIPLPRNADLVSIEASDLQADAAHGKQLTLQATLRNRAPYAQAWPLLELSLTDTQDNAIVRRVLQPADYLPAPIAADPAFAAGSDVALRLWIEAKEVDAAGYRLYVFYP